MQAMTPDRNDNKRHSRGRAGCFKIKCPIRVKYQ